MGVILDKYQDDLPEPENDDSKEVFSFFGLASYWAQNLERSYQQLAVGLSLSKTESITKIELDRLWLEFEKKTLGQLFILVKKTTSLPKPTEKISYDAQDRRNYLTHHFFWHHSKNISSPKGRKIMLKELTEMTNLFRNADKAITKLFLNILREYGVTENDVQEEFVKFLEQVSDNEKNTHN